MPSTYSPLLRFEEIGPGEQAGLWGDTTNKNIGELVEQAIAGVTTVSLSGGAGDYTLSVLNGALDESRGAVLKFIGSPSGPKNIIIPTSTKLYVVRNDCGQTISVKTAAQVTGVTILNGESTLVFCDGTNAVAGIATAGVGPTTVFNGGTGVTSFTGGFVKSLGGTSPLTSAATVNLANEVSGTLPVSSGGTGASSLSVGRVLLGSGTAAVNAYSGLANGHVLTWDSAAQSWVSQAPSAGVLTFSGGTTGLTPSSATGGNITLGGILDIANGGTGANNISQARTNLNIGSVASINTNGNTSQFLRGDGIFASLPTTGITSISAGSGILVNGGVGPVTSGAVTISATSTGGITGVSGSSTITAFTSGSSVFLSQTQAQAIAALGYTPYNSTNPSGYITSASLAGYAQLGAANAFTSASANTFVGNLGVGISSGFAPVNNNLGGVYLQNDGNYIASHTNANPNGFYATFQYGGNIVGSISGNGSTGVAYNTASDRRLKENIVPLTNTGLIIDSLQPRQFVWKSTGQQAKGFIADELQQVIPNAVSGQPNAVDDEGNPIYQGVDCSTPEMIALLVAEVQSLRKRVAELESK